MAKEREKSHSHRGVGGTGLTATGVCFQACWNERGNSSLEKKKERSFSCRNRRRKIKFTGHLDPQEIFNKTS